MLRCFRVWIASAVCLCAACVAGTDSHSRALLAEPTYINGSYDEGQSYAYGFVSGMVLFVVCCSFSMITKYSYTLYPRSTAIVTLVPLTTAVIATLST